VKELLTKLSIQVNSTVYLKDPESSDLGKRIIDGSIELMAELGYEEFTFRKLGLHIESPEASIYRYFESKQKLLLYLVSWYWGWMEYRLVFGLANIASAQERLTKALTILTAEVTQDQHFSHIDEVKLNQLVISESCKAYLHHQVDEENSQGSFAGYKGIVQRVTDIVQELNPDYKYPHMLISTIIEGAHFQRFFAAHLPRLTDVVEGEDAIVNFAVNTVFKAIDHNL